MFVYILKSGTQNERDGFRLMESGFSMLSLRKPNTKTLKNSPLGHKPSPDQTNKPCNGFPDGRDEAF